MVVPRYHKKFTVVSTPYEIQTQFRSIGTSFPEVFYAVLGLGTVTAVRCDELPSSVILRGEREKENKHNERNWTCSLGRYDVGRLAQRCACLVPRLTLTFCIYIVNVLTFRIWS